MSRRAKGVERLGKQVEECGHAVLGAVWSFAVRAVWLLVRAASTVFAAAAEWFQRRSALGRALAASLIVCAIASLTVLWTLRRDPSAPYLVDETEALARVIRSEIGNGSAQQRLHVAWCARNLAIERGETIVEMACSPCGPQERGRPVSSRQPASGADRELASHVLAAPAILDPTGGATHFINPVLQDQLAARAYPGYRGRTYERVRRTWTSSYGWEPYYRLGSDLELWGPKRRR